MSFKDHLEADMNVFLNEHEVGSWHGISIPNQPKNGLPALPSPIVQMLIVVDDDSLRDRKSNASNPTDGVYNADLLFYAKRADFILNFGSIPVVQSFIKFDNRLYKIADVQDDTNMITFTLSRNGS